MASLADVGPVILDRLANCLYRSLYIRGLTAPPCCDLLWYSEYIFCIILPAVGDEITFTSASKFSHLAGQGQPMQVVGYKAGFIFSAAC